MVKLVGLLLVFFLALLVSFPASCLAAESSAAPAAKAAPTAVIDPDMDEGHRQFAHANYEKALEHYLKALEKNKEDAYLYFRIGLTYYMLDDLDKSHDYWLKSYDYDPDLPDKFGSIINSESMRPKLLNGDVIIIDDQHYNYKNAIYNDIINFKIKIKYKGRLSKRIVGLPGDYIEIVNNKVFRNGSNINEKYIYENALDNNRATKNMKRMRVPKNSYFVLGDNRNWSYDSRYFGVVYNSAIFGKVLGIIDGPSTKSQRHKEDQLD